MANKNADSNTQSDQNATASAPRPPTTQPTTAPQYVYEYQWPRIVAVSALCLGLAGGVYYLLPSDSPDISTASTEANLAASAPAQQAAPAPKAQTAIPASGVKSPPPGSIRIVTSSKGPTVLSIGMSAPEPEAAKPTLEVKTAPATEALTQEMAQEEAVTTQPSPKQQSASPSLSASKPAQARQPETLASTETQPAIAAPVPTASIAETTPQKTSTSPSQTEVFSKNIKRAKLTLSMADREPGEAAPESIQMNEGELTKVFFFTEIIGQAGKTVTHLWYQDGKLKAKVRIPIGSDTWRSYSSKYLDDTMTGEWKVKAVDKKGNELARREFNFSS